MPARPPADIRHARFCPKWARVILPALLAWLGSTPAARAGSGGPWEPVSAAELNEAPPAEYPDVPAVVSTWKIDVDERDYPGERQIVEYIRYKIFDPEKAAGITRIEALTTSLNDNDVADVAIRARLTLPDGSSQEFGKDAIQERTVQENGAEDSWATRLLGRTGVSLKERFLAVPGLKAGAILDLQLTQTQKPAQPWSIYNLQKEIYPVRELTFVQHMSDSDKYVLQSSMANDKGRQVEWLPDQKQNLIRVAAHNLPPLAREPFSAPICDRALTVFSSYTPRVARLNLRNTHDYIRGDPKAGPWAAIATFAYLVEHDSTLPTKAISELTARIVGNAQTETEKARRIHRFVVDTCQRFLNRPVEPPAMTRYNSTAWSLAAVAHFEDFQYAGIMTRDFIWLELAMYRAAGLEAQALLVPNRQVMRFNPEFVSEMFLHELVIRVRVDGAWRFSLPTAAIPLAFGELPWPLQGTFGLVAQVNKQEFVRVPALPAADSAAKTTGEFTLAADGSLTGHGQRSLTGSLATALRARLLKKSRTERIESMEESLRAEYPSATTTVSQVDGVDDIDAPLKVEFDMNWSGYAIATKKRIILRPSVFHGTTLSPFSAETRHNLVDFPYLWRQIDEVSVHIPEGYEFESPDAPQSYPRSDLNYEVKLDYAAPTRVLHLHRDFSSQLGYVQVANYAALRELYANIARSDSHELILTTAKPAAGAAAAPAPPKG
ncbi:MAG: hypothetical protein ABSA05_03545 [Opitutaceae bacterium]